MTPAAVGIVACHATRQKGAYDLYAGRANARAGLRASKWANKWANL